MLFPDPLTPDIVVNIPSGNFNFKFFKLFFVTLLIQSSPIFFLLFLGISILSSFKKYFFVKLSLFTLELREPVKIICPPFSPPVIPKSIV